MDSTANATSKTTIAVVREQPFLLCKNISCRTTCFLLAYKEEQYQVTR